MQDMDEIYQQYAQTVYKFLLARTQDPHLAEELTQETFYQALRSMHRFDGSCRLSVWLCQIAKHLWLQQLRRQGREIPAGDDLPEQILPSAEDSALDSIGRLELLRRVHQLTDPAREVVYLRVFGGLSFREIGEVTGHTETWARVTFYRGKEKLKGENEP